MNHSYMQIPSRLGLEIYATDTLNRVGNLKTDEENTTFANDVAQVPYHLDDLTAIVEKCNVKAKFFSNDRSVICIPSTIVRGHAHESELFPESFLDCMERSSKVQHGELGDVNKIEHKTAQLCSLTKRRRVYEEGEEEQYEFSQKSAGGLHYTACSSAKESHILSERLRRTEMNQLFSQLSSVLPNPTAKSDKASIVRETINYIQSLKGHLEICSKKGDNTLPRKQSGSSTVPLKPETTFLAVENDKTAPSNCYSKFCDQILTFNYSGNDIFITLKCERNLNVLPSILLAIESQNIQVVDGFVSTLDAVAFHSLHLKSHEILDPMAKKTFEDTLNKLMRMNSQKHGTKTTRF